MTTKEFEIEYDRLTDEIRNACSSLSFKLLLHLEQKREEILKKWEESLNIDKNDISKHSDKR